MHVVRAWAGVSLLSLEGHTGLTGRWGWGASLWSPVLQHFTGTTGASDRKAVATYGIVKSL